MSMKHIKQSICKFIYFKLLGWKAEVAVPDYDKCIICCAPHTSNWDLIMGKLFINAIERQSGFMMKKDWFFWPIGPIFKAIGGIPVERNKRTSLVQQIAKIAKESKKFHLAITPEGTRSANSKWKKGFYFIATTANIPIVLIGIDYKKKVISATHELTPTGDVEKDMITVKNYFTQFTGKHPKNFAI